MRDFVAILFREKLPVAIIAAGIALAILFLALSIWSLGLFAGVDYDDRQNIAFADALDGQPPPAAIREAAAEGGREFAAKTRAQLKASANDLLRSEDAAEDFADSRPAEANQSAWSDEYICGLKGWGADRAVIRKLILSGYGGCGRIDRFQARAPMLYGGGGFWSWLATLLAPVLLVLLIAFAILLALVRRAYVWLYKSRIRG